MWRRSGSTGTSTPSMRPIDLAHGPAALTTSGVLMSPFEVRTSATRPPASRMPVTSVSRTISTPLACAPCAKPIVTPLGSATPSAAQKVAPRTPVTSSPGASAPPPPATATARPRRGGAAGPRSSRTRPRWRPSTAGRGSRPGGSRSACRPPPRSRAIMRDRLDRQLDVRRVRELVAHAAGVLPGRAGGELRLALDAARRW